MINTTMPQTRPALAPDDVPGLSSTGRLTSVDALRGFDMFWIVGGKPLALAVAGLSCRAGAAAGCGSIPAMLSGSASRRGTSSCRCSCSSSASPCPFLSHGGWSEDNRRRGLYWKILRRTLVLWVLGMVVQGNLLEFNLSTLHLYSNTLAVDCRRLPGRDR